MTPTRRRRFARVVFLRGLRVARRHHFSLLSAAVLSIALVITLGGTGFGFGASETTRPITAAADTPLLLPQSPVASPNLVYYIVDNVDEIRVLKTAIRNDSIYLIEAGLPPLPPVSVYFMLLDTPQREADGARFLTQIAELAPIEGFSLRVVDLTR